MIWKSALPLLVLFLGVVPTAAALAAPAKVDDPQARQILQRAIRAVGGERALARLKSPMMWMERGTFYGMGEPLPFVAQYAAHWPDRFRQEVENAFVITVHGDQAWVSAETGERALEGETARERIRQVHASWAERLFPLWEKDYALSVIAGIEVDGKPTVGIQARHADHRDMKFYFDAETYLIAKIETMVVSPQHGAKPVVSESYFSDHQSFGGVIMPSKVRLNYDRKPFVEAEVVDYKMSATLDPAHFEPPAASPRR